MEWLNKDANNKIWKGFFSIFGSNSMAEKWKIIIKYENNYNSESYLTFSCYSWLLNYSLANTTNSKDPGAGAGNKVKLCTPFPSIGISISIFNLRLGDDINYARPRQHCITLHCDRLSCSRANAGCGAVVIKTVSTFLEALLSITICKELCLRDRGILSIPFIVCR